MKHWLVVIVAGLIVIGAGTALASIPDGESTDFAVDDPAVTVIASGTPIAGGSYGSGTTFFFGEGAEAQTFTAAA